MGNIYSRLTNPTVGALQNRIADLEGGVGAVATSSGHAAQILALYPLLSPGKNVVVSNRLYGGSITQFTQTIKRFGWQAKLVDFDDLNAVQNAIDDNTRALFSETLSNPSGYMIDLKAIATIAKDAGLPYVVDNTIATPYLIRPIEHGANLIVHSLTKYLTGNGTITGGIVVDSGTFDWSASDKFPALSKPNEAYHGLQFHQALGELAFTFFGIAVGLRDLGFTLNPQAAHYTLLGIETLSLRVERHVHNTKQLAEWLENHPAVESIAYSGLKSSRNYGRVQDYSPKGAGALFTVAFKGGYDTARSFVDSLTLFHHVANLGDARSLVIHPASTTHSQLTPEQQAEAGVYPNVVRFSVGLEHIDDLKADIETALKTALKQ